MEDVMTDLHSAADATFKAFDDLSFGVLIQILGRVAHRELESVSQSHGLSAGHLSLLGMVQRYPRRQLRYYGGILAVPEATLSRYTEKLTVLNLVQRHRDKDDGRATLLVATQDGKQIVETVRADLARVNAQFEEALGDTDMDTLRHTIAQFLIRLKLNDRI